jgi:hypothetical protein
VASLGYSIALDGTTWTHLISLLAHRQGDRMGQQNTFRGLRDLGDKILGYKQLKIAKRKNLYLDTADSIVAERGICAALSMMWLKDKLENGVSADRFFVPKDDPFWEANVTMYFPQALQAYKTYKADCANMNATAATTKLAAHFGLNLYKKSDSLKFQQQIPKAKMELECSGFIFHAIVEGAGVAHDTALFRHDT